MVYKEGNPLAGVFPLSLYRGTLLLPLHKRKGPLLSPLLLRLSTGEDVWESLFSSQAFLCDCGSVEAPRCFYGLRTDYEMARSQCHWMVIIRQVFVSREGLQDTRGPPSRRSQHETEGGPLRSGNPLLVQCCFGVCQLVQNFSTPPRKRGVS